MNADRTVVAERYEEGRALPAEVLARWGDAVRPYLPSGSRRVLDLGAGTGIFSRGWPRWSVTHSNALVQSLRPAGNGCIPSAL